MIPNCSKCGASDVYSFSRVSGKAECFFDDMGQRASEQNTDRLEWNPMPRVYCVRCNSVRYDLVINDGILQLRHRRQ